MDLESQLDLAAKLASIDWSAITGGYDDEDIW
jgi:hypothetical protein